MYFLCTANLSINYTNLIINYANKSLLALSDWLWKNRSNQISNITGNSEQISGLLIFLFYFCMEYMNSCCLCKQCCLKNCEKKIYMREMESMIKTKKIEIKPFKLDLKNSKNENQLWNPQTWTEQFLNHASFMFQESMITPISYSNIEYWK